MQIVDVEQGSPEWLAVRLGKVTGTRLAAVMGTPVARNTLINELIAEQLTEMGEDFNPSPAMQRGTDEEPFAIKAYEKKYKCKTHEVGMCVSDEFDWLAHSPDRLRKHGKKFTRGVEVKSPMTKTVVKYLRDGGVPKEYKWQVVNYFLVCEDLKAVDFLIYDPRIRIESMRLTVITITRDQVSDDIEVARKRLVEFKSEWDLAFEQLTF